MKHCDNCGCRVYSGRCCTNCHEELFIVDQYIELGMPLPDKSTDFMKKVASNEAEIHTSKNNSHDTI